MDKDKIEQFAKDAEPERGTLTVPEMAKYLNVGINVAYNLTHKPGFPAVRITKGKIVVPVKLLDQWLEKQVGV